jgi:hypothetical protein
VRCREITNRFAQLLLSKAALSPSATAQSGQAVLSKQAKTRLKSLEKLNDKYNSKEL